MSITHGTAADESDLGSILKHGRLRAGLSIATLSDQAGIAMGQVHKLENNHVQKVNPAHLAALAGPLGLPLHQLYRAAGYPSAGLPLLESELVHTLADLPPEALRHIGRLVHELLETRTAAWEGSLFEAAPNDDAEPTNEDMHERSEIE